MEESEILGDITYRNIKLNEQLYFDQLLATGKIKFEHWYKQVSEYAGRVVQVVASFPDSDEYRVILKGRRVLLNSVDFTLLPEMN